MSHTPLSAQQLYDAAPLGALVRFSDGAVEPPQRHRRKHATWRTSNGTGRLVRKAPQKQGLPASFTLHVGDFGTADVTVVKAYRVFAVTSPLSFAILDKPRPGQVAVLHDDLGMPTFIHLADTEADAQAWLAAHPRDNLRLVPAEALEPRTFTYLQDPGHGWLIVRCGDLAAARCGELDSARARKWKDGRGAIGGTAAGDLPLRLPDLKEFRWRHRRATISTCGRAPGALTQGVAAGSRPLQEAVPTRAQ
jgi:hypothetical protein